MEIEAPKDKVVQLDQDEFAYVDADKGRVTQYCAGSDDDKIPATENSRRSEKSHGVCLTVPPRDLPRVMRHKNMIPMLLKFFPAGASTRTLAHYGQTCSSKRFRQFDYGDPKENALIYGSEEPPEYDLKRVQTSVALFHGGLDLFSPKEVDVDWLKRRLPKVVNAEFLPNFGHLDFHWGLKMYFILEFWVWDFWKLLEARFLEMIESEKIYPVDNVEHRIEVLKASSS
ncbi:unnamed protein product [Notodromas monacha]|uniref:Uncharacterized protein n=1 Tax=Notodromas monacha TaxID=399045 RepID=A0A7R9BSQ9_9CRUS|nr:unnamed protein product [Notodromas monacha]CAG0921035.1 unnamed protein product [Notodromas monacha]